MDLLSMMYQNTYLLTLMTMRTPFFYPQQSVRLVFLIAALNDLDVLVADVSNAYLNAPTQEKVHTICGREFGNALVGRIAVICQALCRLKSSGAAWWNFLVGTLHDKGFAAYVVDPDVWMKANTKQNGEE